MRIHIAPNNASAHKHDLDRPLPITAKRSVSFPRMP
jgi:hypothetical protein